ncbi:GntR family transcriptional regulator [Rhodococcus fascians]|nr:GntR family transcriptional regulator [Rhodococcus fascians]MBY3827334.1 GntR family transcriptional regulator [Rhodococcus fascians]MBY3838002.1 GntR family transcriptional regulator [Rhodococcus fascians]MBY3867274.1 GntR family transcriptional regulator [Rhodococcus fascians]MBY3886349.1 GntR family transcriptional regulator [Rhodococcus fascians]
MTRPFFDDESGSVAAHLRRQADEQRARYLRAQTNRSEKFVTSPRRVYELIRSGIRRGTMPHDEILSEQHLIQSLGATRNAVRKALQMLADDGVVLRARRAGTSIAHDIVAVREGEVGPRAWAGMPDEGRLTVETLECRRIAAPTVIQEFIGTEVDSVILLEQIGRMGGKPLYLRVGYCITDFEIEEFTERIESNHSEYPPIAVAHRRIFGTTYGGSSSVVEAISCQERAAELLDMQVGAPVLLRELITRDTDGRPSELSFTHFRADRVAIIGSTETAATSALG